jgi:hypothetical protein
VGGHCAVVLKRDQLDDACSTRIVTSTECESETRQPFLQYTILRLYDHVSRLM